MSGTELGGGGADGLRAGVQAVTVEFEQPVKDVVNERSGERLGDGKAFKFDFNGIAAVFFSFAGVPPVARPAPAASQPAAEDAPQDKPLSAQELNDWGMQRIRHAQRYIAAGMIWKAAEVLREVIAKTPADAPAHAGAAEMLREYGL